MLLMLPLGVCRAESKKPAKKTIHSTRKTAAHHASETPHARSQRGRLVLASDKKKKSVRSRSRRRKANWRARGQQKIDPQRAHDIQEALIREHYLEGTPSGKWDEATQKALQRYQADNGWQSVTTPDSRALIKLGLGPDHAHLLNPESAMTSNLAPARAESKASRPAGQPVPAAAVSSASRPSAAGAGAGSTEKPATVADPASAGDPPKQ